MLGDQMPDFANGNGCGPYPSGGLFIVSFWTGNIEILQIFRIWNRKQKSNFQVIKMQICLKNNNKLM